MQLDSARATDCAATVSELRWMISAVLATTSPESRDSGRH